MRSLISLLNNFYQTVSLSTGNCEHRWPAHHKHLPVWVHPYKLADRLTAPWNWRGFTELWWPHCRTVPVGFWMFWCLVTHLQLRIWPIIWSTNSILENCFHTSGSWTPTNDCWVWLLPVSHPTAIYDMAIVCNSYQYVSSPWWIRHKRLVKTHTTVGLMLLLGRIHSPPEPTRSHQHSTASRASLCRAGSLASSGWARWFTARATMVVRCVLRGHLHLWPSF